MNDLALPLASLKSRWLNSLLSVFLTAFGVMLAIIILQFGQHIQNRLNADGQNIDIVVGAKGSPLQIVLSSIYHIDIPTGNIPYEDAKKWMNHRQVKTAIPLALGDNWKGYRIVGTTSDYMALYGAEIDTGEIWDTAFEAVSGSAVGLKIGDEFEGAHGLIKGGHVHDNEKYKIVGTLKETGTVLDRLILTSLDSVLNIHGQKSIEHDHSDEHEHDTHNHSEEHHGHDHNDESHAHDHEEEHHAHDHEDKHHAHDHDAHKESPEITALLLTTRSPMANMNLPRMINRNSALQAATPALEITRLTSMLGLGSKTFTAVSTVLIIIAALSIFAGLSSGLENRMRDLAVLRALGYSKARLIKIIATEGFIIVISGIAIGTAMGIYGFQALSHIITPLQSSGAKVHFTPEFILILSAVLMAGMVASIIPAIRAGRVDAAKQLSKGF